MLMATPQWAMAQCGSSLAICRNSFSASSYQKECSRATPRAKGCCTDAEQETGKWTVPSCVSVRSSWWWWFLSSSSATAVNEIRTENSSTHARRFMEGPHGRRDGILVTRGGRVKLAVEAYQFFSSWSRKILNPLMLWIRDRRLGGKILRRKDLHVKYSGIRG